MCNNNKKEKLPCSTHSGSAAIAVHKLRQAAGNYCAHSSSSLFIFGGAIVAIVVTYSSPKAATGGRIIIFSHFSDAFLITGTVAAGIEFVPARQDRVRNKLLRLSVELLKFVKKLYR